MGMGYYFYTLYLVLFLRSLFHPKEFLFSNHKIITMKRFFTLIGIPVYFTLSFNQVMAQSTLVSSSNSKESVGIPESKFGIVLQALNITQSGNAVKLNWQTSAEKDHNYFEIQRSTDGINFTVIALMFAYEDAEKGGTYRYSDLGISSLNSGILYYRLKMVDRKGNSKLVPSQKIDISNPVVHN